jgi:hypothetical protein
MGTSRRQFLQSAAASLAVVGVGPMRLTAAFDPLEKNIGELQRAMASGQITSAQLVQFYLDRIAAYDPLVNAVLYVNPNAAADARALDAERRRGNARGPLHGIPILLKDNFDTKDMPTTGGALALSGVIPKDDAFQVKKLREAGAVILGKVNLHELALGLTTVSSLGGQTLDPYDLTRAPGGSSGGSASPASGPRSASRAAQASSRSATRRTPAARSRGRSKTSPSSSTRQWDLTRRTSRRPQAEGRSRRPTRRSSDATRSKARALGCSPSCLERLLKTAW